MKKILCLFVALLLCGSTQAAYVLVDFGGLAPANPVNGLYFNQWNPGNNLDLVLATDGVTDSGWNLDSSTGAAVNNGVSPDYTFTYSGAPEPFNSDTITSDGLNLIPSDGVRNVRLLNLDVAQKYDVVIYGARQGDSETRITAYSVIGDSTYNGNLTTTGDGIGSGGADYNTDNTYTVRAVTPDANGRITINYSVDTGDFGYLNAISFGESVPEPSSLALLLLGGGALWRGARRRS